MPILHLGVHNVPYAAQFTERPPAKRQRTFSKAQQGYGAGKTTGDIALILESKYNIMHKFYELEKRNIISTLSKSIHGSIKNILMGQPPGILPTAEVMEVIKTKFKENLSLQRYDGMISGVPTAAALRGVSHRFKKPYAKRASRPSFIDSGLYQSSFTAWMTEK
jgi:hypothetical protein